MAIEYRDDVGEKNNKSGRTSEYHKLDDEYMFVSVSEKRKWTNRYIMT
jgi:hypothetical protein